MYEYRARQIYTGIYYHIIKRHKKAMTENNLSLLYNIRYPPFRSIVLHAHQCMTVYPLFKDIPAINKFDPYYASANNPFTSFHRCHSPADY
jgi:hypothetical protein